MHEYKKAGVEHPCFIYKAFPFFLAVKKGLTLW